LKAYMLKLDLTLQMAAWREDDYIERTIFKYKSRSPELRDDTIEATEDKFLLDVTLSEQYEGCEMEILETEVVSNEPLVDEPLRQLPIHTWRPSVNLLSEHDNDINIIKTKSMRHQRILIHAMEPLHEVETDQTD
jgi:hypothetical protein